MVFRGKPLERDVKMHELFEKCSIGAMELGNRFVRSATWEGMADEDGRSNARLAGLMRELAENQVGLIITGHAYVREEGKAGIRQLAVFGDECVAGLSEMTHGVHAAGGKIVLQVAHAGLHALQSKEGLEPLGPSPLQTPKGVVGRAMTMEEVQLVVAAFGDAAARARQAGFDGVQIHAAHGYLLSQFLSPYYNKRTDAYGGELLNRARIVLEVYESIRKAVGPEFPVLIKLNSEDFLDGGLSVDEMLQVSELLQSRGIAAVEMSGGTALSGNRFPIRKGVAKSEEEEPFYHEAASRFKNRLEVPLILVGGLRSLGSAERLVKSGTADFIALCRPLIREPHLIRRWKEGDRRKATCISDNLCFGPAFKGLGIACVTEEKLRSRAKNG
jgi:2,4-dienoyl-CoA reductase-like NADH-dependent reductase (Old Yellow Enzyme family)